MLHWAPILLWWFLSDCSQDTRKQRLRYPRLNFHNDLPFFPLPPLFTSAGNDWANDDFPSMYCTSKALAEWGLCTISHLTILSEIWNFIFICYRARAIHIHNNQDKEHISKWKGSGTWHLKKQKRFCFYERHIFFYHSALMEITSTPEYLVQRLKCIIECIEMFLSHFDMIGKSRVDCALFFLQKYVLLSQAIQEASHLP